MKFNIVYKQLMNENITMKEFIVIKDFSSTGSQFEKDEIYTGNIYEVTLDGSLNIHEFKRDKDNNIIIPIEPATTEPIQAYKITNITAIERKAKRDRYNNGMTIFVRRDSIKIK